MTGAFGPGPDFLARAIDEAIASRPPLVGCPCADRLRRAWIASGATVDRLADDLVVEMTNADAAGGFRCDVTPLAGLA
jgi:hypothetical protein